MRELGLTPREQHDSANALFLAKEYEKMQKDLEKGPGFIQTICAWIARKVNEKMKKNLAEK